MYIESALAVSLRNLLQLSKLLKSRRKVLGALELASSEIGFNVDEETGMPLNVRQKDHLQTMSMIEEVTTFLHKICIMYKIYIKILFFTYAFQRFQIILFLSSISNIFQFFAGFTDLLVNKTAIGDSPGTKHIEIQFYSLMYYKISFSSISAVFCLRFL